MQGELHICRKELCYFVVWSPTEFHYQVSAMVWFGTALQSDMVWYGMVWYGLVRYSMVSYKSWEKFPNIPQAQIYGQKCSPKHISINLNTTKVHICKFFLSSVSYGRVRCWSPLSSIIRSCRAQFIPQGASYLQLAMFKGHKVHLHLVLINKFIFALLKFGASIHLFKAP